MIARVPHRDRRTACSTSRPNPCNNPHCAVTHDELVRLRPEREHRCHNIELAEYRDRHPDETVRDQEYRGRANPAELMHSAHCPRNVDRLNYCPEMKKRNTLVHRGEAHRAMETPGVHSLPLRQMLLRQLSMRGSWLQHRRSRIVASLRSVFPRMIRALSMSGILDAVLSHRAASCK